MESRFSTGLRFFDLRENRNIRLLFRQQCLYAPHISRFPHKRDGHVIHPQLDSKAQVVFIFRGKRFHTQVHSRQVHPLFLSQTAAVDHLSFHVSSRSSQNPQCNQPVVQKNAVSFPDISG